MNQQAQQTAGLRNSISGTLIINGIKKSKELTNIKYLSIAMNKEREDENTTFFLQETHKEQY